MKATNKNFTTMEDKVTEKVYCYDHPSAYNNNDALAIAAMANSRKSESDPAAMMAMMNGGMNSWQNNPFIYLVLMWMFGNGNGFGFGNNRCIEGAELQNQISQLRNAMTDNHNSDLLMEAIRGNGCSINQLASNLNCDFNSLQTAICGVQSAIDKVGGAVGFSAERVINAVQMGDSNIISTLQNCCCQTQQEIIKSNYENRLAIAEQTTNLRNGQRDLGSVITQGFSQLGYQQNQDKCDIINASSANTQRIIDTLNNHWKDELALQVQDLKFQNSQLKQNQFLAGLINGGCCGNGIC